MTCLHRYQSVTFCSAVPLKHPFIHQKPRNYFYDHSFLQHSKQLFQKRTVFESGTYAEIKADFLYGSTRLASIGLTWSEACS